MTGMARASCGLQTPAVSADPAASSTCPRCGGGFHCGANDTAPCACSTLQLSPATLAALRERYSLCLCLSCLQAISKGGVL
jgi:hypothetical protein